MSIDIFSPKNHTNLHTQQRFIKMLISLEPCKMYYETFIFVSLIHQSFSIILDSMLVYYKRNRNAPLYYVTVKFTIFVYIYIISKKINPML